MMKKVLIFGLCFLIVLSSFAVCFADGGSPVILPVGNQSNLTSGYFVPMAGSVQDRYYRASSSPVYMVFYSETEGGPYKALFFSETSGSHVYNNSVVDVTAVDFSLNNTYNGYYFATTSTFPVDNNAIVIYDPSFTSPQSVIDYVNDSVFSTTFSLTYIVDGSISWLNSAVTAVMNNTLLLFMILVMFCGVGIGLLNRFRKG